MLHSTHPGFQHRPARLRTALAHLQDETGSALIELAVILSLLGIPLLLGTIYYGVLLMNYIEVTDAAHAGALYAMRSSTYAEDSPGIAAAARADASSIGTNLIVTPSIYYVCSDAQDGTQYTLQSDANSSCTGGTSHSLEFVQVITSASITPPAGFPGLPRTVSVSSTSSMEVEE